MPEQLMRVIQPLKARWDALTRQQKIRLLAAVLVVLLALGVVVYFTTRTQYVVAYNKLNSNEIKEIQNTLDELGIKNNMVQNGTALEVDKKQVDRARVELESRNVLSTATFTYADALSNSGMGVTETMKRESLLRAKQTELAQSIKSFDGVTNADVHLSIPDNTKYLIPNQDKATASAVLKTSRDLSANEGLAIARFLCRSVEGLDMENIEITDTNYHILYSGQQDQIGTFGSFTDMLEWERKILITQVRGLFMPLYDEINVATNLIYDTDLIVEDSREFGLPNESGDAGVPRTTIESSNNVQGSPNSDEPGLGANDQQSPDYQMDEGGSYSAKSADKQITWDYNEYVTHRESSSNGYLRADSSLAATFYRYVPYYQESEMKSNKDFTQSDWEALKRNTGDRVIQDDVKLQLHINDIATATGIDPSRISVTIWEVPVFYDYVKPPVEIQQIIMFAVLALLILMLAYGIIRQTKPEEEEEIEPELTVEDLLVSTQLEEAKEEAEKLDEIEYGKESEFKKNIEKFVNENPAAVAQLLRNWLNSEDW